MGERGAWAEDEGAHGRHGDSDDRAVLGDPLHAGVIDFEATVLKIERRPAILGGRERVERGLFEDGHGRNALKRWTTLPVSDAESSPDLQVVAETPRRTPGPETR